MEIGLIAIISYLLGSIPFGFLLTKIFLKKDIRKIGSGNIGNAFVNEQWPRTGRFLFQGVLGPYGSIWGEIL